MGGSNFAIWVHLVVHTFCLLKHFLPHDSPLFDPIFPDAPEPFNHMPIVKFVLGCMKLYGAYVCLEAGLSSFMKARKDLKRYKSLLSCLDKVLLRNATKKPDGKRPYTLEPVILRQGIIDAKHHSEGGFISGLGGIAVAIFFAVSALNYLKILKYLSIHPSIQFHYPEITIHSLILLEFSLLYMLKPIYEHAMSLYNYATRGMRLSEKVALLEEKKAAEASSKKKKAKSDSGEEASAKLTAVEFLVAASEVGYSSSQLMETLKLSQKYPLKLTSLSGNYPPSNKSKDEIMEENIEKDLDYLQKILGFSPVTSGSKASAASAKDEDDGPWRDVGGENGQCTSENSCISNEIALKSSKSLVHANIDFGVFALNALAVFFYVFILTGHYIPYDKLQLDASSLQLLRMLHFEMSSAEAAHYGEFLGDLAWTIEPALDLLAPTIMAVMFAKPAKAEKATDGKKKSE